MQHDPLADAAFEQATTLEEVQEQHAAFVELLNTTPHWAHREWEDGLRTPVEVLRWVRGHEIDREALQRALRHLQMERVVTLRGYVSVQRFYVYAERGLSRKRVSVWLHEGRLHLAYRETLLARYAYRYDRKAKRLREVDSPRLFKTPYASPQLEFWELDDEQSYKITGRPYERRATLPESTLQHRLLLTGGT